MKKGILILLSVSLIATLTACGSSDGSASEDTTGQTEEETVDEGNTETNYLTAIYNDLEYSYPDDWSYQESDGSVVLTSADGQAMILLMAISTSDSGYTEDNIGDLLDDSLLAITSDVLDTQLEESEDYTIAGCTAKVNAGKVLNTNNVWLNYAGLAMYDSEGQYVYMIPYMAAVDSDEYLAKYQDLLDSITIDPALLDNSDQANNAVEDSASDENVIKSENGYDITYQDFRIYENSLGKICMDAIVQIKNTGSKNLQLRSSSFTLTDDAGNLAGMVSYTNEDPKTILPGEYGYFYINDHEIDGDVSADGNYTFVPELSVKETNTDPVTYEISDTSISEGKYDKADIMGRITNTTNQDASLIWISFVLFDSDDKPLGVYGTNVSDVAAGETKSFDADAIGLINADFTYSDVARYEVCARK